MNRAIMAYVSWADVSGFFVHVVMPVSLLDAPREIVEEIILCATRNNTLGPPREWRSLVLTCRTMHRLLSFESSSTLGGRIFMQKFDQAAPARRLDHLLPYHLKVELRRRFVILGYARHGVRLSSTPSAHLLEIFMTCYLMLLEDDVKNMAQLAFVGVPKLVDDFLQERLFVGSEANNGWPLEDEINTLAISLFWFFSSRASIETETTKLRCLRLTFLGFYAFAAFRYPCHNTLEDRYYPSISDEGFASRRRSCFPSPLQSTELLYFGRKIRFQPPSLAPFAILSYFARLETTPLCVPDAIPATRQSANATGWQGPTREDIKLANTQCQTHFVDFYTSSSLSSVTKGERHDADWARAINGTQPSLGLGVTPPCLYSPGTLAGSWRGFSISPCRFGYGSLLSRLEPPSELPLCSRRPLYLTLREHYCYSPALPVPLDSEDNGLANAWLPSSSRWIEQEKGISIYDDRGSFKVFYETFKPVVGPSADSSMSGPDSSASRYAGAVDIIITGETDALRGEAWGRYKAIGRIRPHDGLIVLLVEPYDPQHPRLGRWIYRGYVISSQNFVGRWRDGASGTGVADWEAMFSLCKEPCA